MDPSGGAAAGRIFIALDFPEPERALEMARALAPLGVRFKVGLELFARGGPAVVRRLQELAGPLFLDLKLHDIPNTMAGAARAASALGVGWLTAHAAAGAAALSRTAAAAPDTALLGVTVLTSLGPDDLAAQAVARPLAAQVLALARQAVGAGCRGVVASPREAAVLRGALAAGTQVVATGVRPAGAGVDDQARPGTPGAAISAGADFIVVGRAVTAAADPLAAARAVVAEVAEAARA